MQQVNLYQPILRKQEKIFSAKTLLQGNLVVLVGLALIYVYTMLQTQDLQQQLLDTRQQHQEQLDRLTQLAERYPEKPKDASLPARIEKARAALQYKRQLLAGVQELGLDSSVQFSDHLAGLARQDLPELWLQHIQLQYGQQVELKGSAYKAEEVPIYLQRLSTEPAFNGTSFKSVIIMRNEEFANRVDFTVSSASLEAEERQ